MQEAFNKDAEKYYREKEQKRKAKKEADRLAQKRQWSEINRLRDEEEARHARMKLAADKRQKSFLDPLQKTTPTPTPTEAPISTYSLNNKISELSRQVQGAENSSSDDSSTHNKKRKKKKKDKKEKKEKKSNKKDKLQALRMERYLREARESIREKRIT